MSGTVSALIDESSIGINYFFSCGEELLLVTNTPVKKILSNNWV